MRRMRITDSSRPVVGVHLVVPAVRAPEVARAAEEVGADSVWVSDHLVWVDGAGQYPYSEDGTPPVPSQTPFFDPWVLLASVAAATTTIQLGTYVYVLPLRPALVTARAVATLDTLSGGRVILGAGIGWMREEFEAAGEGFDDRAQRAEEIVALLRRAWADPQVAFEGSTVRVPPVRMEPKPPQGGRLPVHFGGETSAALRRAAVLGDGWLGMPHTPATAAERVHRLRALRRASGRSEDIEISVGAPWPLTAADLGAYAAAGVDRVIVRPWERGRDWAAGIEQLGEVLATHQLRG
jgi:probable F420-dependent oxidoreductase